MYRLHTMCWLFCFCFINTVWYGCNRVSAIRLGRWKGIQCFFYFDIYPNCHHDTVCRHTSKLIMRTCSVMRLKKSESQSWWSFLKMMYFYIAFYKWVSNDKLYFIIIVIVIIITCITNCTSTNILSKFYDLWYVKYVCLQCYMHY